MHKVLKHFFQGDQMKIGAKLGWGSRVTRNPETRETEAIFGTRNPSEKPVRVRVFNFAYFGLKRGILETLWQLYKGIWHILLIFFLVCCLQRNLVAAYWITW